MKPGASLMPQRVNRIKPGRLERGEVAENHPDSGGEEEGDEDDLEIREKGDIQHLAEAVRGEQGQHDADDSAQ